MKQMKTTRRGFTLLEMIIVIGIITILTAVFVPAINGYLTRSRLNTSNANAKVIFNSMQTICQEMEFAERGAEDTVLYGPMYTTRNGQPVKRNDSAKRSITICVADGKVQKAKVELDYYLQDAPNSYNGMSTWTLLCAPGGGSGMTVPGWDILKALDDPLVYNDVTKKYQSGSTSTVMQRMDRLFADNSTVAYCVLIEEYTVKGVICATSLNSTYLGGFPQKAIDRGGFEAHKTTTPSNAPFNTSSAWDMDDIFGGSNYGFDGIMEAYVRN